MERVQIGGIGTDPGAKASGYLHVSGSTVRMPMTVVNGVAPGPTVLITGGVHGGEYPGIEASIRLAQELDASTLRGTVVVIHPVNLLSFFARQQYLVPADGKNLNRQFPGKALGTVSERIAATLMTELVARADAWIDLHGGDIHEGLVPFTIYSDLGEGAVVEASKRMAEVYGIEYVIASDSVKGSTYAAAAAIGVPCILAEAGQVGQLDEDCVQIHLRGCRNVLRDLGNLAAEPEPVAPIRLLGEFAWVFVENPGCWYPSVSLGDTVEAGQTVGHVRDFFGATLESPRSPASGTILFLVTSLAVNEGDPLLAIGAE